MILPDYSIEGRGITREGGTSRLRDWNEDATPYSRGIEKTARGMGGQHDWTDTQDAQQRQVMGSGGGGRKIFASSYNIADYKNPALVRKFTPPGIGGISYTTSPPQTALFRIYCRLSEPIPFDPTAVPPKPAEMLLTASALGNFKLVSSNLSGGFATYDWNDGRLVFEDWNPDTLCWNVQPANISAAWIPFYEILATKKAPAEMIITEMMNGSEQCTQTQTMWPALSYILGGAPGAIYGMRFEFLSGDTLQETFQLEGMHDAFIYTTE